MIWMSLAAEPGTFHSKLIDIAIQSGIRHGVGAAAIDGQNAQIIEEGQWFGVLGVIIESRESLCAPSKCL